MIVGVGIDVIEIQRIRAAIEKWGARFLNRVFSLEEIAYSQRHTVPFQHFAGRFAAKEAIYKALGDSSISWLDITIVNDSSGKPSCLVRGISSDKIVHISISHSKYYAVANAVIETQ